MAYKESERVELKERISTTLPKEIVTFLNTNGGTIFIGVDDFGHIKGIPNLDADMRTISDILSDQISPRCLDFVSQEHFVEDGFDLIKVSVKKGNHLFYIKKYGLSENGCYIRNGTSCKSLSPEEIMARFIDYLVIPEKQITDIPSSYNVLSFQI